MAITLSNLIDPEVMADIIDYKMVDRIKFSNMATVDTTLVGQPGSTITLPKYTYIGDAEEFLEGNDISYGTLTQTSVDVTVKKAGRGVQLTDEAMLSGYGDPKGEAGKQIQVAIQQKLDNDCKASYDGIAAAMTVGDGSATLSSTTIALGLEKFGEEIEEPMALYIAPSQRSEIMNDTNFIPATEARAAMMISGSIGQVLGCDLIVSSKLHADENGYINNFIVKAGALKIYLKRGVMVETARDIDKKITKVNADQHYVTYLYDASKAVKIVSKASASTPSV